MNSLYLVPKTKLLPPSIGEDILHRPKIVERLYAAATTKRLTLVSAQAGAGKTTAVTSLHHAHPELALAWLSLDEDDNQSLQFGTALLATIQTLLPKDVMTAATVLQGAADNENALRLIIRALINDLIDHGANPFVLVLDDLHVISNQSILQALDYLLEHLPPALHLVVTTRQDPPLAISKLRVRNQLAEIRIKDLRFAKDEMTSLLNDTFGLALLPNDLVRLEARTEGWVAGIRLLTLSLADIPSDQRSAFIDRFAQSHAFIFDYLMDEVLNQQEPIVRQFLLETSILRELTPTLCAAITGRSDCAQLLDQLQRRNLFLTRQEFALRKPANIESIGMEPTYRYHDLFAQFLRQQLSQSVGAERVRELHKQAAIASPSLNRAVRHYVAGEWWDEAAEVIEVEGKRQLEEVYVRQNIGYWSEQLPADLLAERPWLLLLRGFRSLDTGQHKEADALFEIAMQQFIAEGDTLGEAMSFYGLNRYRENRLSDMQKRLDVLEGAYGKHPFFVVAQVSQEMEKAWSAMHAQKWDEVYQHTKAGTEFAIEQGSIAAMRTVVRNYGGDFLFSELSIQEVTRFWQIVDQTYSAQDAMVNTCAKWGRALIEFYSGNMTQSEQLAKIASERLDRLGGDIVIYFSLDNIILFSKLSRADYASAQDYLVKIQPRLASVESYRNNFVYTYFRARLAWATQDVSAIANHVQSLQNFTSSKFISQKEQAVSTLEAQGLGSWSEGRIAEASVYFQKAAALQQETRHTVFCTDNRLNLAMLYTEQGKNEDALEQLAPALGQWAQKEMPGVVLQSGPQIIPALKLAINHNVEAAFADQVLALFGEAAETRPIPIPESNATLTPREVDVLRLIVRGSSNQAIANELVISLNTVKSHITRVLAKLNVTSRTQAAAKARTLGI